MTTITHSLPEYDALAAEDTINHMERKLNQMEEPNAPAHLSLYIADCLDSLGMRSCFDAQKVEQLRQLGAKFRNGEADTRSIEEARNTRQQLFGALEGAAA